MPHKAGFVNILGNPNVGKSTLMNLLVGERLSIITSKAQTTRKRIMGIVNGDDFQVIYSDTPGIVKPAYELHQNMMQYINTALEDADIILYMVEVGEKEVKDEAVLQKLQNTNVPLLLIINKIDLATEEKVKASSEIWKERLPQAEQIFISAIKGFNTQAVWDRIMEYLPENPPYYPKDSLTDKPERFFAAEIIREKIFLLYKQEIPYSVEVDIEQFKEADNIIHISALLYVTRDSQKGILIGKKGEALKKAGTSARISLEEFFQKKVFLETFVKVRKDWRDNKNLLKQFGY